MNVALSFAGINDFPNASEEDVEAALPVLAAAGVPLLAHAELLENIPPTEVIDTHSVTRAPCDLQQLVCGISGASNTRC